MHFQAHGDHARVNIRGTDRVEREVRKTFKQLFSIGVNGVPGTTLSRHGTAIRYPYRECAYNRFGIVTVPDSEVALCNLQNIHRLFHSVELATYSWLHIHADDCPDG
jgi:hypothetical protein